MKALSKILRLEWVIAAAVAVAFYVHLGGSWWLFALLVLTPDLSMLGYLAGPRFGAMAYNAAHVIFWPAALAALSLFAGPVYAQLALIWFVHIAVDRAAGYGLKLPTGFHDTHLGPLGGA